MNKEQTQKGNCCGTTAHEQWFYNVFIKRFNIVVVFVMRENMDGIIDRDSQ